jgi:hypothetical protein
MYRHSKIHVPRKTKTTLNNEVCTYNLEQMTLFRVMTKDHSIIID